MAKSIEVRGRKKRKQKTGREKNGLKIRESGYLNACSSPLQANKGLIMYLPSPR